MRRFALVLTCLLLAGCSDENGSSDTSDAPDGSDVSESDIGSFDAWPDSAADVDEDTEGDAAEDVVEDAAEDPMDVGEDAPEDTEPDTADTADTGRPDTQADVIDAPDVSDVNDVDAIDAADIADEPDSPDDPDAVDASDAADTSDDAGDVDADVVEPQECNGAPRSFDGTFCEGGCTVGLDELLPVDPGFRNGSPALALDPDCDPQILFSLAEGGYSGFHGIRRDDGWAVSPTPAGFARASYVLDDAGIGYSLTGGGAFELWGHAFGLGTRGWSSLPAIGFEGHTRAGNLIMGERGSVQGTVVDRSGNLYLMTLGELAWASTPTGISTSSTAFRTSPGDSGTPHVTTFSTADGAWQLEWWTPDTGAEVAAPLGSSSLGAVAQAFDLAVGASNRGNPGGVPHILLGREGDTACNQPMSVVSRNADGTWSEASIPTIPDATCDRCDRMADGPGDVCEYDWVDFMPFAVLVSQGGDVAALYTRRHWTGTQVAECDGRFCFWAGGSSENTSDLYLARPSFRSPVLLMEDDAWFSDGRTMVDSLGRIHIAAYDQGTTRLTVRYVRLDPAP